MCRYVFLVRVDADGQYLVDEYHPLSPITLLEGRERAYALEQAQRFLSYHPIKEDLKKIDRMRLKAIQSNELLDEVFIVTGVQPFNQEELQEVVDLAVETVGQEAFRQQFAVPARDAVPSGGRTDAVVCERSTRSALLD